MQGGHEIVPDKHSLPMLDEYGVHGHVDAHHAGMQHDDVHG